MRRTHEDDDGGRGAAQRVLRLDTLNAAFRSCRYAVRGALYKAAQARLKEGKDVIFTNVGNPHALGQRPVSFERAVLALVFAPFLLEDPRACALFPSDVLERARHYLEQVKGGVGAYSDSKGSAFLRAEIAGFFSRRDGLDLDPEHLFLTNGASEAVRMVLQSFIREGVGILVPSPQYPLYSASIELYGGMMLPYELDETSGWTLSMAALEEALRRGHAAHPNLDVRAMVIINPGNPTGQCLSEDNIAEILRFCHERRIVLLADEVYQSNIYCPEEHPFVSCRQVLAHACRKPVRSEVELFSFHTVSKGVYGECGLRGGCVACSNIDPDVMDEMYKVASINLSPNVPGQVALALMCNPPRPGEPSYTAYRRETNGIHASLQRRAKRLVDAFNELEGVTCQITTGAMYCFPQITIPQRAMAEAERKGLQPDALYCLALLDETGICVVPGSGFGQAEGTFHFRTTILPGEDMIDEVVHKFRSFHAQFMAQYTGDPGSPLARSRL